MLSVLFLCFLLANGRRKIESMKKFSVKQKLKAFLAAALCVCMAASPLTAFAESLPEQEESILSDNFDELVRKAAEENKEHEAEQIALNSADEGLVVKTYASGKGDVRMKKNRLLILQLVKLFATRRKTGIKE